MVSGSPGPSRSLHRVSPNRFEGFGALALVCFVAARRSHGLRPSLARGADALGLVCVVIVPSRCSDCSVHPTLSSRSNGCPPSWFVRSAGRCLVRVSKDRPSTVSGAEESASRVGVATFASESGCRPPRVPPSWFLTTVADFSFSTLPGCCTGLPVMGFVMFRRCDSESPSRVSTLRSLSPRKQRAPYDSHRDDAGPASPVLVAQSGSPRALPPRPSARHPDST